MPATAIQPVERVVLHDMSWEFYGRLLEELGDSPGTRVTYDNGLLQIMVISAAHDNPNRTLAYIVQIVAEETGVDFCHLGSTTFQRPDLLKGFEPDSCYYFRNAAIVRDIDQIDLLDDPPPELVIEIDVSGNAFNRFSIFAAVGVEEVWHYKNGSVTMYALREGAYVPVTHSVALPVLSAEAAGYFTQAFRKKVSPVWTRELREWVRSATKSTSPQP